MKRKPEQAIRKGSIKKAIKNYIEALRHVRHKGIPSSSIFNSFYITSPFYLQHTRSMIKQTS
jgi:hypothetical protein